MGIRAIFVDAGGTLLHPREPVGMTYARAARKRGISAGPVRTEQRFRLAWKRAAATPQAGDGRTFWRPIVAESLQSDDPALFESLYLWYAQPRAWWVDTEALRVLGHLSRQGIRLGILSNWDTRLRELYLGFALDRLFPYLVCSAEVELAKPDPDIFRLACRVAGVAPNEAVHVGDDPELDVAGASRAGLVGLSFDDERGWRGLESEIAILRRGSGFFARS